MKGEGRLGGEGKSVPRELLDEKRKTLRVTESPARRCGVERDATQRRKKPSGAV